MGKTSRKHELRIVFDGVIAVGPPFPEQGDEEDGPYFGVMARSVRQPSNRFRRVKNGPHRGPQYIPMHVPSVYTTMRPAKDSRPPDEVFQLSKFHPEWFIWHPVRERMEFRFDGKGTPGKLRYVDSIEPRAKHGAEFGQARLHSIRRVPDAREVCPGRTFLIDGLMSAKTPVNELAAAQILVPWGRVFGGGVNDKAEGVDVFFDPPPSRKKRVEKRVVPNTVVAVDAGNVEIATYSLDTGTRLDSIKFQLKEGAEIWISNGDPSDTAIDLDLLSKDIARVRHGKDPDTFLEKLREPFDKIIKKKSRWADVKKLFVEFTGSNPVSSAVASEKFARVSEVDIDFELFYTLLAGKNTRLSVPVKADLQPFDGPNCLVKQVRTRDRLHLKSNKRR